MQANILLSKTTSSLGSLVPTVKIGCLGQLTQVRNHVKVYPWRKNRQNRESYLDNTKTPYTDKHNVNEFMADKRKRKPWQTVIPKEKDHTYMAYRFNDAYENDPKEAKRIAQTKMLSFKNSLLARGAPRESPPYSPPENVAGRILALVRSSQLTAESQQETTNNRLSNDNDSDENLLQMRLDENKTLKLSVIQKCVKEFGHDLPSHDLLNIRTLKHVVDYFETPVIGVNPYTALLRQDDQLPPNLFLIPEPIRYDRETDVRFGGHSAYPGLVNTVPGIRAAEKYPALNQDDFQWPDI